MTGKDQFIEIRIYVHTHVRIDISTYSHGYVVSKEFVECDVQNTENYVSCEWRQNEWKRGGENISNKSCPRKWTTSLYPFKFRGAQMFCTMTHFWAGHSNLTFRGPCIVIYSYNKTNDMNFISQIYFWNRTLHVSNSFSVHHQGSSTVHTAIHTGYADCLLASSQHNLYDIYLLLSVQC